MHEVADYPIPPHLPVAACCRLCSTSALHFSLRTERAKQNYLEYIREYSSQHLQDYHVVYVL